MITKIRFDLEIWVFFREKRHWKVHELRDFVGLSSILIQIEILKDGEAK